MRFTILGRVHNDTRFCATEAEETFMAVDHIANSSSHEWPTMPEARWLGVIPHIKGLTGKDYPQLPFSVELLINETTHFRGSFLARRTRPC